MVVKMGEGGGERDTGRVSVSNHNLNTGMYARMYAHTYRIVTVSTFTMCRHIAITLIFNHQQAEVALYDSVTKRKVIT